MLVHDTLDSFFTGIAFYSFCESIWTGKHVPEAVLHADIKKSPIFIYHLIESGPAGMGGFVSRLYLARSFKQKKEMQMYKLHLKQWAIG